MLLTGAHLCHRGQQQLWISDISSRNRRWQCALQLILRPDLYLWCIASHCALGPIFCITGLGSSSLPIALVTIVTSTIYVRNAKFKVKKNWKARSGGCRLSPHYSTDYHQVCRTKQGWFDHKAWTSCNSILGFLFSNFSTF